MSGANGGDPADTRPLVDVAVGVVIRADGRVLLGQRVAGKPYAGWWEFPGGKLEAGEDAAAALARELDEELGLQVRASCPWVIREFSYPHARVRLFFRRVWDWGGEPQSREGQAFAWLAPDAIDVAPLLPATEPVLAWLRLAPVYAISHGAALGEPAFLAALDRALQGGLRLVQLREKSLAPQAFDALFHQVLQRCRAAGARLLVNSFHDERYWRAADGVHLTGAALAALDRRPQVPLVAASCHGVEDLAQAGRLGLDFVVLGPVLPTASHPGAPALGWHQFLAMTGNTPVPVFALGGLSAADLDCARQAGAHGVAMLGAAWR